MTPRDIPYGLGCGGTVDVLLERADTPEFEALMQAMEASLQGECRRVFTQLPETPTRFTRCVLDAQGSTVFQGEHRAIEAALPLFDEMLIPPQRLIVFGAGDDAVPLVNMAAMLGWRTLVIDGRPQWARAARFPQAELVATSLDGITLAAGDAVVVMTHSYEQDREWLARALPVQPRYLGLLGARHRSALLVQESRDRTRLDARACVFGAVRSGGA